MKVMGKGAGIRTNREGKRRVKDALLAPQILAIIGGTVVLVVVVMLTMSALARAVGARINSAFLAFAIGVLVTTSFFVLAGIVTVFSGGVNWIVGGRAERWTEEVLEELGPEWRIRNNLVFSDGKPPDTWEVDVDHVAVGPGGVLVVESKYSSIPIDLDAERLKWPVGDDAAQVARNVQRVRGLIRDLPGPLPVTALLVYWGFRVKSPKEPVRRLGRSVQIVMGADADRWLPTLTDHVLDPQVVQEIWQRIEEHETDSPGKAST